jgi:peptide/nickel transport system substrate-binding protein
MRRTYVISTRRTKRIIALAVGLSLVAAACGGDDDDTTGDDDDVVVDDTTDADADVDDTTDADADADDDDMTDTTDADADAGAGGGILIWAHEQEPPDLHLDDPENNLTTTAWTRQALWDGLYGITGSVEYFPELLAEEGVITENGDGSVTGTFKLREGLVWSDGDDLTADDVKYTFDVIMAADGEDDEGNPNYVYLIGGRAGYDTITDFTVVSPTEFTITWSAFFAGWKAILAEIHPSHMFPADPLEAAAAENDALREWNVDGTVIPSSGPMIFDSWEKGVQMNMVRNDLYNGSMSPDVTNRGLAYVDGVQINYVTDTDAQINALLAGEAQIVMTQPQLAFEQLAESEDFTVAASAGPVFEHWGLNLLNKHLAKPGVREGLAFAMDKSEVMAGLYTPLFGDLLPAEGLGNTYWLSNQSSYENHSAEAGYGAGDIDSAKAAIEAEGYVLGGDGVYEHPEDGRLSLRVGTTGGNRLREIQQQLLQAKFSEAGIEITIDNVEGGAYFNERPFAEEAIACSTSGGTEGNCDVWDITQFAWVGGPWPGGQSASYLTGNGNNPYGYANPDFDARSVECDSIVDDVARAACYNELDKYVTTLSIDPNGLFMLPITQKPSFYGFTSDLSTNGVSPDANSAGPIVNVVDYQFAG